MNKNTMQMAAQMASANAQAGANSGGSDMMGSVVSGLASLAGLFG